MLQNIQKSTHIDQKPDLTILNHSWEVVASDVPDHERLLALSTSLAGTLSGFRVVYGQEKPRSMQLIDIDRHLRSCLSIDSALAVAV